MRNKAQAWMPNCGQRAWHLTVKEELVVRKKTIITCLVAVVAVIALCLALIVGLVAYLAMLPRQRYDDADAAATLELGTQLMQDWLDENKPGTALTSSNNVLFQYPSGPSYLTDYVEGTYLDDGVDYRFALNVINRDVYLEDADNSLDGAIASYLIETLGLPANTEVEAPRAELLVPFLVEGSTREAPTEYLHFDYLLPAGVSDAGAWLRDPSSRCKVACNCYVRPDDAVDLTVFTFDELLAIRDRAGLSYESLGLRNINTSIDALYDHYYLEHFSWGDAGPFHVRYRDHYLEQELGYRGEVKEVGSAVIDFDHDVVIVENDDSYVVYFRNDSVNHDCWIYADQDSSVTSHDWDWVVATEARQHLIWKDRGKFGWCLCTEDGLAFDFIEKGELQPNYGKTTNDLP
jgi:hypothetical protein